MKKGFTLIELLVVVAIIGLLASVVLASLNIARARATNSAITANMQTVRSVSELYYDDHSGSYGTPLVMDPSGAQGAYGYGCDSSQQGWGGNLFDDLKIQEAMNASEVLYGTPNLHGCAVGVGGQTWVLFAPLKTMPLTYWCISSVGVAKTLPASAPSNLAAFGGGDIPAVCP